MKTPLVSILCVSFNHEKYIRSCLEGFVNQTCDFDFEVLIHDDASTDGTQEIIKEFQEKYPEIIKPILQTENQWSKSPGSINLRFNYPRARGEYIAMCDGDDVWIDKQKLAKQVSFLENHPECILTCSAYNLLNEKGRKPIVKNNFFSVENEDKNGFYFGLDALTKEWFIRNSTLMVRNLKDKINLLEKYESTFDMHLFFQALNLGKGYYSKEVLIDYNQHKGGEYSRRTSLEILVVHYSILKEMYEKDPHPFLKHHYLKALLLMINLNISGILSFRKVKIPHKNVQLRLSQIFKEAASLAETKQEKRRLKRSFIPIQLKKIKKKLMR